MSGRSVTTSTPRGERVNGAVERIEARCADTSVMPLAHPRIRSDRLSLTPSRPNCLPRLSLTWWTCGYSLSERGWGGRPQISVDVPRLAVGVYATTTTTPLFFAQAVGRFVRARRRGETATVFLPSTGHLLGLAGEMEVERDHVLGRPVSSDDDIFAAEQALLDREQQAEAASADEQLMPFQALGSEARFDRVLYDGGEFGHAGEVHVGSEEEMDFLGIPGLLEPDQVRELLHHRQSERAKQRSSAPEQRAEGPEKATYERLALLRRELNGLVAAWNHRTGQPHGVVHARLRKECGGPAAAVASAEQLEARIDLVRSWAAARRE